MRTDLRSLVRFPTYKELAALFLCVEYMNELDPEVPEDKVDLRWQSTAEFSMDYEYAKTLMVNFCGKLRVGGEEGMREAMLEQEEKFETFLEMLNACTNRKDRHLRVKPRNVMKSLMG